MVMGEEEKLILHESSSSPPPQPWGSRVGAGWGLTQDERTGTDDYTTSNG